MDRALIAAGVALALLAACGCDRRGQEQEAARAEAQELRTEKQQLTAQVQTLKAQMEELQTRVSQIKEDLQDARAKAGQADSLREQLSEAEQKLAAIEERNAEATGDTTDPALNVERARARLVELGRRLFEQQEYDTALSIFISARELGERTAESLYRTAYCYANAGRYQDARRWYEEALAAMEQAEAAKPELLAKCLNNYGVALVKLGEPAAAIDALQRAIATDKSLSAAHFNLALAHRAQGQHEQAVKTLRGYVAAGGARSASARNIIREILDAEPDASNN